jgi:hypothetical protein
VRTQCALLAAADLDDFDDLASHLAILASGLDRQWRDQLECAAIREAAAGRRLGWLAFTFSAPPKPSTWELPEQLRYLEKLTPRTPPAPMVMAPRGGWR